MDFTEMLRTLVSLFGQEGGGGVTSKLRLLRHEKEGLVLRWENRQKLKGSCLYLVSKLVEGYLKDCIDASILGMAGSFP